MADDKKTLTTGFGMPVDNDLDSMTAGPKGPGPGGGERGAADSERAPRGFAVKFYTEEGNYDMVGNNTPVFFIRDPLKFPDFIHTQQRNPATHPKDPDMFGDFLSLTPEE